MPSPKERYATDPEYRAKKIAASRATYEKRKSDPEFRAKRNAAKRARQLRVRAEVVRLKESSPCVDCGNSYPAEVMDFDHVRGAKRYKVSRMIVSASMAAVLTEIEKCDLVCANCHRLRTAARREAA